jgi:DNA mismatch repair ATPase MutS
MNGLSSYASEIIKISNILTDCRQRELLVLIDEPARTTNPVEGKALVQAIIKILEQCPSFTLITTHYSGLGASCRRLRVKGFVEDMTDIPLTPQSINRFIDYSLTEDQSDNVPHEALRIAAILNCDSEMISLAKESIESIK